MVSVAGKLALFKISSSLLGQTLAFSHPKLSQRPAKLSATARRGYPNGAYLSPRKPTSQKVDFYPRRFSPQAFYCAYTTRILLASPDSDCDAASFFKKSEASVTMFSSIAT